MTQEFFDHYAEALLARDAKAIAGMYAVPSLILFPGNAIPVTDAAQRPSSSSPRPGRSTKASPRSPSRSP